MIDALIPNKQKRHNPLLIAIVSNRLKNKGKKQRYKNKKQKIHHQSNLLYGVSTKGNNNNSMQDAYNTNCKLPVDVDETTVLYIRFT